MGCLKSILKKILLLAILIAFFAFGGHRFVIDKIAQYKYPPRDVFVETEKNYGDFSNVSGDYQLYRDFNFFGYKKINAKYLPTEQKITIFDLKNEDLISKADFDTHVIDSKIEEVLNKLKDSLITFEDFEIIQRGKYQAKGKQIPYIAYKAHVKNLFFKEVKGVFAAYSLENEDKKNSTVIITSTVDSKAFNPKIISDFVSAIEFE